ncbi:hypothetical protein XELAEV_18043663mg [Xenopus laevis]|uniref:ABC transporter domain-containing protein n=1 Tax=Xenopus laevis TaxID=8355 RepID=A0A974BXZ5_XENLA|nr:hypothetical protein XELAEV_18043663mg [Xenopus laevis]
MVEPKLRETSLFQQTLALFWKNLLLKWRRKWHTTLEWLQNLAFLFPMFLLTALDQPAATPSLVHTSPARVLGPLDAFNNFSIGYVHTTSTSRDIMEKVAKSIIIPGKISIVYIIFKLNVLLFQFTSNHSVWNNMASIVAMKMKSAEHQSFLQFVHVGTIIFIMPLCYVSLMYLLSLYMTRERYEMKEILRVMRLKDLAFWLSWGLLYACYVLIMANLMTLVTKHFIFVTSSYGIIMLLFFLYGIALMSFTFMLSALFRNPRATAIAGFIVTLLLSALGLVVLSKDLPKALEVLLSIFPQFAFAVGLVQSVHMESDLEGIYLSDLMGASSHVLSSFISLALDSVFYMILTLYLEKVLADKHGVKHEPLFFLKKSYWSKEKSSPPMVGTDDRDESSVGDYVEKVPTDMHGKEAIRIHGVKKTYSDDDKNTEALRGLDLNIYEGQITALLGHSGAGKTTLLNILSGMCPTSGVLSDLQMNDMENIEANKLSGGQKRKLTFAIAILGDPQILLLDEPTAGLDPCSRHHIWTILKENKADRVTLFSTQFMDEADILADRKAVISKGRLKCVGSSLFLKRKWGIGYHLRSEHYYDVFRAESRTTEDREDFSAEMEESLLLMSDSGNVTLSGFALWRQQVLAVARIRLLKLRHDTKSFRSILLLLVLFILPPVIINILASIYSQYEWELTPSLYFQSPGNRLNKYYTDLLICNNTGSSIEDFVGAVKEQNVAVYVTSGKYDMDTVKYRGAIEVSQAEKGYNFTIVGNPKSHNSLPVLLNIISNALLKVLKVSEHIRVWNHPIPLGYMNRFHTSYLTMSFFMIFATGLSPHIAMSSTEDNRINARTQLRVSSLFPSAYWFGQALVDVILYWILLFLMFIYFAFNSFLLLDFVPAMVMITGIIGYGMAMILYVYVICFIFGKGKSHNDSWSLFFVIPYLHIIIFFGLLWFLEWRFGLRCLTIDPLFRISRRQMTIKKNPEELSDDVDEDVLAEKERVKKAANVTNVEEKPVIIVDSLRKEYKVKKGGSFFKKNRKAATKNISFCVRKGEVLGLLGPNGAGKTTSMYMLAGEVKPTAGEVTRMLSSPLQIAEALELKEHMEKAARKLSLGVSRKVCFAISMLGNPNIVLLDEPSTGLDPKGQQRLWSAIRAAFKNKDRGAILTTHYMEEAEAVCDRVAIMVSGKIRCIGSIQQLKSKFGKGYLLEIKVKESHQVDQIHKEIIRIFPHAARQDRFSSLLVYKIPKDNVQSLSQVFLLLEEAKRAYNIEEYSFSQSTLEQVFIELAKEQEKEDFGLNNTFQWRHLRTESI